MPSFPPQSRKAARSKMSSSQKSSVNSEKPVVYINVVVLSAKEAIQMKVSQKISKGGDTSNPFKKLAEKAIPKFASDFLSTDSVAKNMSQKVCEKMPSKMKEKGITAVMEEVFREGPYIVLQLQVQHVDTVMLASSGNQSDDSDGEGEADAIGKGKAAETKPSKTRRFLSLLWGCLIGLLTFFLRIIGLRRKSSLEDDYIPNLVQSKLSTMMDAMLAEKLKEKRLEAESRVLTEAKQARFFYNTLKQVRILSGSGGSSSSGSGGGGGSGSGSGNAGSNSLSDSRNISGSGGGGGSKDEGSTSTSATSTTASSSSTTTSEGGSGGDKTPPKGKLSGVLPGRPLAGRGMPPMPKMPSFRKKKN